MTKQQRIDELVEDIIWIGLRIPPTDDLCHPLATKARLLAAIADGSTQEEFDEED